MNTHLIVFLRSNFTIIVSIRIQKSATYHVHDIFLVILIYMKYRVVSMLSNGVSYFHFLSGERFFLTEISIRVELG